MNKQQLFSFLSHKLESMVCAEGKHLFATIGPSVVSIGVRHPMQVCNHEEADTTILIHLQDALDNGATICLVRTVDTDVIVIIVSKFYDLLQQHPAADIWFAFGTGTNFRYIHIHTMCSVLGIEKSNTLPPFHSFTGGDTTSTFLGKEKVCMGSMEIIPRGNQRISLYGQSSTYTSHY